MNRTGMAWAFAALALGTLVAACSSSSGGSPSGVTGPSCPAGSMSAAMGQTNTACNQCLQSKCATASQCIVTDCAAFESCYCPCAATDNACHANCASQLTSGSCATCVQNSVTCQTQNCSSECQGGSPDGG